MPLMPLKVETTSSADSERLREKTLKKQFSKVFPTLEPKVLEQNNIRITEKSFIFGYLDQYLRKCCVFGHN